VFVRRFLPETKGHSVEQITHQLEEDAARRPVAIPAQRSA